MTNDIQPKVHPMQPFVFRLRHNWFPSNNIRVVRSVLRLSCDIEVVPDSNHRCHLRQNLRHHVTFNDARLTTCHHVAIDSNRIITDSLSVRIYLVHSTFQRRILGLVTRSKYHIRLPIMLLLWSDDSKLFDKETNGTCFSATARCSMLSTHTIAVPSFVLLLSSRTILDSNFSRLVSNNYPTSIFQCETYTNGNLL